MNFSAKDLIPDFKGLNKKLVLKGLKPNEQKNVSVTVQLPDNSEHLSATIVFVKQINAKKSLVRGLAIIALNKALKIGTQPIIVQVAVPVSILFRPYSTFPKSNFITPDKIFCSNFGI